MTTPQQTFPVTIEKAWHSLMTQLGTTNIARANEVKFCAKSVHQLMKRR